MMQAFFINSPMNSQTRETEIPVPKEDEILLKVMASGVCGTDVHIYKGEYFGGYPRIPGHEFSGIIEAVGEKVTVLKKGQHVSADPNIFCENCDACKENRQNFCQDMQAIGVTRHGAFAQFLTVPEQCVFDITGLSFTAGAILFFGVLSRERSRSNQLGKNLPCIPRVRGRSEHSSVIGLRFTSPFESDHT